MKFIVKLPIVEGFVPTYRLIDGSSPHVGSSIISDRLEKAANDGRIGNIIQHEFYDFESESDAIVVDIEAYVIEAKNHPQWKDGTSIVYDSPSQ